MADASYQANVYREQGGNKLVVTTGGAIELWGTDLTVTGAELNTLDNVVATATWTISTEVTATSSRLAEVALKDAAGTAIVGPKMITLALFGDAAGANLFTSSTGPAVSTGSFGYFRPWSADAPLFTAMCSTAGVVGIKWTDTGSSVAYIGVILPNGTYSIGATALTIP